MVLASKPALAAGKRVVEVARELGISERTLRRAFAHEVGVNPVQWAVNNERETITRQRVREAEKLLLETDATLVEISEQVGFAQASGLTQGFRRVHGMTPSEWRKNKVRR